MHLFSSLPTIYKSPPPGTSNKPKILSKNKVLKGRKQEDKREKKKGRGKGKRSGKREKEKGKRGQRVYFSLYEKAVAHKI